MLEDTILISYFPAIRARRLGLGLLLLAVPACGLSDYEALMREAQEREEILRAEQKYLGQPVQIPTTKDKEDHDVPLANVFFRPPKGIDPKPQQRGLSWRYGASSSSDFIAVDMAFGEESKDFSRSILDNYGRGDLSPGTPRQITPPGQKTLVVFDVWEFSDAQNGYSVNIPRGSTKPLAIVFIYQRTRFDNARKLIELSLQALGLDQSFSTARTRASQKSPWKLKPS